MLQIVAITLTLALVQCDLQDRWRPEEFPNPRTDIDECGRNGISSSICDPHQYLSTTEGNQLENLIKQARNTTECRCSHAYCARGTGGVKIGVAIVNQMVPQRDVEDSRMALSYTLDGAALFAQHLDRNWRFGECDDTILILYVPKDHVIYTHTGDLIAKTLTNQLVAEISMAHRHYFESGQIFKGVHNMIDNYISVLRGTYTARVNRPQPLALGIAGGATQLVASVVMVITTLLLHRF